MDNPKDLLSFLEAKSIEFVIRLYRNSVFSIFIVKILPQSTVSFLFDLLHQAKNITKLKNTKEVIKSIKALRSLHLLKKQGPNLYLNEDFRESLLKGFATINFEHFFISSPNFYEEKVSKKFEKILQDIVDPKSYEIKIKNILAHGELIDESSTITHKGFEFLLKTHKDQMWLLIIYGLLLVTPKESDQEIYLLGLAEMSHKKTRMCYRARFPLKILKFFDELGLIDLVENNLMFLRNDFKILFENEVKELNKFLFVETNHKIYAYTSSKYEIAIMSLFCKIDFFISFLAVCSISEDSVRKAFEKGITAQQIVNYLSSYSKALPKPICDIIFVWESQRNRMEILDVYLYTNFLNFADFQKVLFFCKENEFLIDYDERKRMIMVKQESHPFLKDFVRKNI